VVKGLLTLLAFLFFLVACSQPGDNTDDTIDPPPVSDSSYTILDSGNKGCVVFTWHIPVSGTAVDLGDESFSGRILLGFEFQLFDSIYGGAYINSNGFITLQSTVSGSDCSPRQVPDSSGVNSIIAGLWADLNPSAGGNIYYETLGEVPDRIFIVTYNSIPYSDLTSGNVTFQILLYETTNNIEIQYLNFVTDGSNHTQGIEDAAGARGCFSPGMNLENFTLTDKYIVRFSPQ